ncbi:unnamed protein product [Parajaminaea phylloscopi]
MLIVDVAQQLSRPVRRNNTRSSDHGRQSVIRRIAQSSVRSCRSSPVSRVRNASIWAGLWRAARESISVQERTFRNFPLNRRRSPSPPSSSALLHTSILCIDIEYSD